jgi:hypothetical protein
LKRSEEIHRAAESELVNTKKVVARSAQALADSLGRSKALEEVLSHLRRVSRSVVMEVLGPRPGSSALAADLSEIPGKVAGHITDGVFHGASGVLTSVSLHYPTLHFEAVGRARWSADRLRELGQSLVPAAMSIEEVTTAEWVVIAII